MAIARTWVDLEQPLLDLAEDMEDIAHVMRRASDFELQLDEDGDAETRYGFASGPATSLRSWLEIVRVTRLPIIVEVDCEEDAHYFRREGFEVDYALEKT